MDTVICVGGILLLFVLIIFFYLLNTARKRNAPIRRKKSTDFPRGRPFCFFDLRKGRPYPIRTGVSCRESCAVSIPGKPTDPSQTCRPLALCRSWCSARLLAPGEAESGSAGVQPDKEYPGRRCTDAAVRAQLRERRRSLRLPPQRRQCRIRR